MSDWRRGKRASPPLSLSALYMDEGEKAGERKERKCMDRRMEGKEGTEGDCFSHAQTNFSTWGMKLSADKNPFRS